LTAKSAGSIPAPNGIPNTITIPLEYPNFPIIPNIVTTPNRINTNHRPACYFLSLRRPVKGKTQNGII
jgi:hypothetical protein